MILFGNTLVLILGDFREVFFSTFWSPRFTGEEGCTIDEVPVFFKGVLGDFLEDSGVEGEEILGEDDDDFLKKNRT